MLCFIYFSVILLKILWCFNFDFSEYDVTLDIDNPLDVINNLIQKISIATKDSQSIFFLDEIFGKNQVGETNVQCDW